MSIDYEIAEKLARGFLTDNDGELPTHHALYVHELMESLPSFIQRVANEAMAEQKERDIQAVVGIPNGTEAIAAIRALSTQEKK